MQQLCFATNNLHKLEEVKALLSGKFPILSLNDIGCGEEIPETMNTITGNASQKSNFVWDRYHIPCFADDTGLEVNALNGDPGVYSARYAGPQRNAADNIRLLLKNLEGKSNRKAQFRTVISLRLPKEEFIFEGIVPGTIINDERGTGGFGYDPVFLPDGHSKTLAEMSMDEKNLISHRARAVEKLVRYLQSNNAIGESLHL